MLATLSKAGCCNNFSEAEKALFAKLVKEYGMIENKGYDTGTLEKKNKA